MNYTEQILIDIRTNRQENCALFVVPAIYFVKEG